MHTASAVSASAKGGQSTPTDEKPISVALNTGAAQEKLLYDVESSAAASPVSPSFGIGQQELTGR